MGSHVAWCFFLSLLLFVVPGFGATGSAQNKGEAYAPPAAKAGAGTSSRSDPGGLLWEDRYDAGPFEQAFSAATLQGRVFAAGYVSNPTRRDFVVRAYDGATGTLAWQDQVNLGGDDFASGVTTDGKRVFVSGTTVRPGTSQDWILRAYDAGTGRLLWQDTFDLAGRSDFSRGTALAAGNGLVFLGGYGTNLQDVGDLNTDYIVRAHDAASGALVWQDSISGFSGAYSMALEEGRLFVGGWNDTADSDGAIVRAYDATTGSLLWQQRTPGAAGFQQTWTRDVVAHDGRVTVAQPRRATAPPFALAPLVQTYDARSGRLLWRDEFNTAGAQVWLNEVDSFEGRAFAVGYGGANCGDGSNCDTVIRAYDASSGAIGWERQLEFSGVDDSAELVLASRGVVFVFSQAEAIVGVPGCCFVGRWVVQAFKSSNGELLWQSLGGNLESGVYNMVVDRARLFIPGRSIDAATGQWDFIVRAYDIRGHSSEIDPIFAAPRNLQLTGTSGLVSYEVTFGGTLTTAAHGAIPAEEQPGTVLDDPTNSINSALASGIGVTFHTITVPAGSRLFQVSLFDTETDGSDDLDVYVFRVGGGFVSSSAGATSEERVTIENPVPGDYIVVIHGYETDGPDANYTLFDWVLGNVAVGNLTVSGPLPPTGPSGTVTVSWSGLLPGLRYLGSVSYDDGTGEIGQTFISITP